MCKRPAVVLGGGNLSQERRKSKPKEDEKWANKFFLHFQGLFAYGEKFSKIKPSVNMFIIVKSIFMVHITFKACMINRETRLGMCSKAFATWVSPTFPNPSGPVLMPRPVGVSEPTSLCAVESLAW